MAWSTPEDSEWLRAYAKVQTVTDRQILAVLHNAYRDISRMLRALEGKQGIGAAVRREQLLLVRQSILTRLAQIYREMNLIIVAQRLEAGAAAINLGTRVNGVLFQSAGRADLVPLLRDGVMAGMERTIEVVTTRMTQSRFDLAQRIYRSELWTQGQVERLINSALARGLTAKEFAKEARVLFNPNTPGGIRFAAFRLARTEINNSFHAISVNQVAEAPWITGMKWHLSRSHPKSDDCDALANEDRFDMGPGVFPTEQVPRKPHPQCFCYVTPISLDEDAFLDGLVAGKFDPYIRKTTGLA